MKTEHKTTSVNAIKQLKELNLMQQRIKFPSMPDAYRFTPKYNDTTSNGLTKCIVDLIRLSGYFVERTGNEGRVIDNRQTYKDVLGYSKTIGSITRIKSSGTTGTSDLKAIVKGKFIAIEIKCKATNDKQRPSQREYQKQIEQSGGVYYTARDFSSFYQWFNLTFKEGD